jgi:tRNA-dihydrouridine synthase
MRRHYANYFRSLPDFKPYRTRLVEADAAQEVHAILDEIKDVFSLQMTLA